MKYTITLLALLFITGSQAQITTDFEDFGLEQNTFLNGSEGVSVYMGEGVEFPIFYDTAFAAWTGWAISTMTDTETAGFSNQYSAITGGGAEDSETYAVSYHFIPNSLTKTEGEFVGMSITNGTYPYLSMRDGDMFAKKFGGVDGNDPDFFLLTIRGYADGELVDSIDFYLADYRFEDNSQDYIVNEWTYIDLSPLASVEELTFTLTSSDVGMFGVNTPTYFCMDNMIINFGTATDEKLLGQSVSLFPNPTSDILTIEIEKIDALQATVTNAQGQVVMNINVSGSTSVDVSTLKPGIYTLNISTEEGMIAKRFMKK